MIILGSSSSPGASLMDIRQLTDNLTLVHCPGCGACHLLTPRPADVTFVHEGDACPVLARIEAALAKLRTTEQRLRC